jgi:hypothetical protein
MQIQITGLRGFARKDHVISEKHRVLRRIKVDSCIANALTLEQLFCRITIVITQKRHKLLLQYFGHLGYYAVRTKMLEPFPQANSQQFVRSASWTEECFTAELELVELCAYGKRLLTVYRSLPTDIH